MNDDLTFGQKIQLKLNNGKAWVSAKVSIAWTWAKEHPTEALAIIGAATAGTNKVIKVARLHEERVHRERDFYDPRCGKYTRARRRLRTWERDEIERRYRNGESYYQILRDLDLKR